MAKRKRRRSSRSRNKQQFPGWLWMLFGLSLGLSVAFAIYVKDDPATSPSNQAAQPQAASTQNSLDNNGEMPAATASETEKKERRFTFYTLLPDFELIVPDKRPEVEADLEPAAIVEPGVYVLQAGSFSTNQDADRRRAELALQGIESHIQRVKINDKNYHRVYVGPTEDLDELNMLRSRLRAAKIDVFRIRISD
jgi:cell division protein FtsN